MIHRVLPFVLLAAFLMTWLAPAGARAGERQEAREGEAREGEGSEAPPPAEEPASQDEPPETPGRT